MSDDIDDPNSLLNELDSIKGLLDEELESEAQYQSMEEISSVEEYVRIKHKAAEAGISITEYLEQRAEEAASAETNAPLPEESQQDDISAHEEQAAPSTAEATTVEEYFAAVAAAKREQREPSPAVPPPQVEMEVEATTATEEATDSIPLLDDVIEPELEIPVLDEVAEVEQEIPVLDEIVEPEPEIPVLDEPTGMEEAIPTLDEVVAADETPPSLHDDLPGGAAAFREGMDLEEMQILVDLIVNRKLERLKPELEKEVITELQKMLPLSALTKS